MRAAALIAKSLARHHGGCAGRGMVAGIRRALRRFFDPYRPERHYMRGPGPKCREKRQTRS